MRRSQPDGEHIKNELDSVADVAAIKDIGDVRQRHHYESPRIGRKSSLDALLDERQRGFLASIPCVNPPQPLFDQTLVPTVGRLIGPMKSAVGLCESKAGRSRASSRPNLVSVLQEGGKSANIHVRSGAMWRIPD
ncbi:MAG TPA: hypothetical protein VNZ53_43790 [Steroidobacteraceae bacterium]|jgi:hypothetical protein|nr:hypothetical protein [Steroidobacteraceae bacterium]